MKELLKIAAWIVIVPIVILIGVYFVAPAVNDLSVPAFEKEVMDGLDLPENAEVVEYVSGCGNSSGTGNHTDLYVAVLIRSDLTRRELADVYGNLRVSEYDGEQTLAMSIIGLDFEEKTGGEGFYVVEFSKTAPMSMFDIRGM